jgi:type IV secretion system protein VirB1
MKKIFILFFIFAGCYADIRMEIADAIKETANKSGLDARVYYTIAKIESGFEPWCIGLIGNAQLIKAIKDLKVFDVKTSKTGDNYLVSVISSSKEDIIALAKVLYPLNINFDVGLMQISKQHIEENEIEKIFEPNYNLAKGSNILYGCANKFKEIKASIECYNKGFNVGNNKKYYELFLSSYNRNFGAAK